MLRRRFIRNYHKQSKYEKEKRALTADDEYYLKQTRPITDNAVKTLPKNQLDKFIDDVLNHKHLTKVLYSSNANLEIKNLKKSKLSAQRNFYTKHKQVKYDPHDFIRNRTIKEAYVQIKDEISKFKQENQTYKNNLLQKNKTGYLKIKQENKENQQRSVKLLHQNRIERYTRTFEFLKDKLLQEKINASDNEVVNGLNTQTTLNETHHKRQHTISSFSCITNNTNINTNHTNSNNNMGCCLYYCDTAPSSRSSKRISFPKVKLDINNVYSRLYHNAVIPIKKRKHRRVLSSNNNMINININNTTKHKKRNSLRLNLNDSHNNSEHDLNENNDLKMNTHSNYNTSNNKIKFKLKSALKDMNNHGKEFTIKIDDKVYNNCFSKYSGGPEIYEKLKRRIELDNKTGIYSIYKYNDKGMSNEVDFYNLKLEDGNSFLHIVTNGGFPEMVRYFLEKGANVNIVNSKGDTPLHIAVRNKNEEIINLLMEFKAKVGICNNSNEVVYVSSDGKKKKYRIEKEYIEKQHMK